MMILLSFLSDGPVKRLTFTHTMCALRTENVSILPTVYPREDTASKLFPFAKKRDVYDSAAACPFIARHDRVAGCFLTT